MLHTLRLLSIYVRCRQPAHGRDGVLFTRLLVRPICQSHTTMKIIYGFKVLEHSGCGGGGGERKYRRSRGTVPGGADLPFGYGLAVGVAPCIVRLDTGFSGVAVGAFARVLRLFHISFSSFFLLLISKSVGRCTLPSTEYPH